MAENKRPLITVDSPPKHIDFASMKKQRTIAKNNKTLLQSPMAGDRNYNAGGVTTGNDRLSVLVDAARMQLISPPPEEMLRRNSRPSAQFTPSLLENTGASSVNPSTHGITAAAKRKRNQPAFTYSTPSLLRDVDSMNEDESGIQYPQLMEATPNPKPRKQGRLLSRQPSFESPTRLPALVLPPPKASGSALGRTLLSRRSATPITPYEPPADVFTPPREVFLSSMLMTKSSKRKIITMASGSKSAKGKKKVSTLTILTAVKQELPDIDLSLPMPPPSPSDDPLLLLGPPKPEFDPEPRPPRRREISVEQVRHMSVEPEQLLGNAADSADVSLDAEHLEDGGSLELSGKGSTKPIIPHDVQQSLSGLPSDLQQQEEEQEVSQISVGFDDDDEEPASSFDLPSQFTENLVCGIPAVSIFQPRRPSPAPAIEPVVFPSFESFTENLAHGNQAGYIPTFQPRQPSPALALQPSAFPSFESENLACGHPAVSIIQPRQPSPAPAIEPIVFPSFESSTENPAAGNQAGYIPTFQPHQPSPALATESVVFPAFESPTENLACGNQTGYFPTFQPRQPSPAPAIQPSAFSSFESSTENLVCGNQAMSIPTFQLRQVSPAPAIESVVFPSFESRPEAVLSSHSIVLEHEVAPAANFKSNYGAQTIVLEQGEDDDQSSDDGDELSLVKITSADPRAAARAAAILKQHDYDCYTNIIKRRHLEAKHRRGSHSDMEDFAKESRRRDICSSGIAKVSDSRRRRSTLGMGVIGDRVFIPGSPAITLPELLQEAELEVRNSPQSLSQRLVFPGRGGRDPFKTPTSAKYRAQTANTWMTEQKTEVYHSDIGEREWTREDWKQLDACFTDQRLEVGSELAGAEQNLLAPVDTISINDVVDKFVVLKGGLETVTNFGALWSRENLLERTRALQKKQRSGHTAPPTTPYTPLSAGCQSNVLGGKERVPCMEVPDFTPLRRRAAPPRKSRLISQQPVMHDIAIQDVTPEQEGPIIPPTLLAPRYSHLLEEAISISQQGSSPSPRQETRNRIPQSEIEDTAHSSDVPSTTIGKRVKGFLFSYLPTLPKSSPTTKKAPISLQPSLPIPPNDILTKPRSHVTTPARAPLPKPKHPKELVVLHPAPQPSTISHIPRLAKPRRLVELRPPAPLPMAEPTPIPRPRRSSGNSVKDLVRGYEELQVATHDKLKRTKSSEGSKRYADRRPQWKP